MGNPGVQKEHPLVNNNKKHQLTAYVFNPIDFLADWLTATDPLMKLFNHWS